MKNPEIKQVRGLISTGKISLEQQVQQYLKEIDDKNGTLNAFTFVDREYATERAKEIAAKLKNGSGGKLAGAVIGVKEAIVQKGRKATSGSKILQNFESVYSSTAVERLEKEDAVILGRLNMDEFAMGSSNETSFHGPAKNPHDPSKVPGGSSGGSAAAVAAGFCNGALGSDTGGSIRQPASFCGVVGLKPTYGRVSRHGLIAYASSFDCIGPMTNSVEDAALMLEVIAGRDPMDSTTPDEPTHEWTQFTQNPDPKLRIGIPEEYFGEGLDAEIGERVMQITKDLESKGAELIPLKLPNSRFGIATYYILATAEASSNLARYDGVRYGHRADMKAIREKITAEKKAAEKEGGDDPESALHRLYKESRTEGFGTEVKRRIMLGTYVLSAGYYDAYYGKAQKIRRLIQNDFNSAFEKVDVIISPTAPTTAFGLNEKMDDPLQMYLNDIYTISANLAGIPGISLPAGKHSNGLPVGVQFMAPHFREDQLFRAGKLVEQLFD